MEGESERSRRDVNKEEEGERGEFSTPAATRGGGGGGGAAAAAGIPPPLFLHGHLASMTPGEVERAHRRYYLENGLPREDIPRNAYQYQIRAQQLRAERAGYREGRLNFDAVSPIQPPNFDAVSPIQQLSWSSVSPSPSPSPSPRITFSKEHNNILNETCPVCLDDFETAEELRHLPCNHFFHPHCVRDWFSSQRDASQHRTCPICRSFLSNPNR